jgi:hypothetical protein
MSRNAASGFDLPVLRNENGGTQRIWGSQMAVYAIAISGIIELDQIPSSMRLI